MLKAECRLLLVRDHPPHLGRVGIAHQSVGVEMTLALRRFGGKDMALKGLAALDLAAGGLLEPLGRAFMGFHFGHKFTGSGCALVEPVSFSSSFTLQLL